MNLCWMRGGGLFIFSPAFAGLRQGAGIVLLSGSLGSKSGAQNLELWKQGTGA